MGSASGIREGLRGIATKRRRTRTCPRSLRFNSSRRLRRRRQSCDTRGLHWPNVKILPNHFLRYSTSSSQLGRRNLSRPSTRSSLIRLLKSSAHHRPADLNVDRLSSHLLPTHATLLLPTTPPTFPFPLHLRLPLPLSPPNLLAPSSVACLHTLLFQRTPLPSIGLLPLHLLTSLSLASVTSHHSRESLLLRRCPVKSRYERFACPPLPSLALVHCFRRTGRWLAIVLESC